MLYPDKLEQGYKIGVTATSAGLSAEVDQIRLDNAIKHFKTLGYPVEESPNVRKNDKGRSSDAKTRATELMDLFKDHEVRAIIAASGGDYLVEMLPYLDYNMIKENPKWFQGYSDNTGLTFTITTNLDIATIYTNNFGTFGMEHWHSSLQDNIKILEGSDLLQESSDQFQNGFIERITGLEEFALNKDARWINCIPSKLSTAQDEITMKGRSIGGCLDVLLHLVGTRFDKTKQFIEKYRQDGILWYLESFALNSEALYQGLWQLKEAGWFEHATGFLFGRPAFYSSDLEITYEEAVLSVLGELNLPIILDADVGHKPPQFTMMNGAIATIHSEGGKGNIFFERR